MAFATPAILVEAADPGSVIPASQLYMSAILSVLFVSRVLTVAVLYNVTGLNIVAMVSFYTLLP